MPDITKYSSTDKTNKPVMSQGKVKGEGTRKTPRTNSKIVKCEDCGIKISNTTRALNCEKCYKVWSCITCLNMSHELYDMMQNDNNLKWLCTECKKCLTEKKEHEMDTGRGEIKELIQSMSEDLKTRLGRLEDLLLKKVDKKDHDELVERVAALEEREDNQYMPDITGIEEAIEAKVTACIDEYREREARKLNLIVHNLPEPEQDTPEERNTADMEEMKVVLEEIECEQASIEHVQRLGMKVEGGQKPRLALVKMKNVASKRMVLASAKKLRNSRKETLKNTYISPDMSPAMRKEQRELRKQLKERKEQGEEDLVIKKGKIVNRHETESDHRLPGAVGGIPDAEDA